MHHQSVLALYDRHGDLLEVEKMRRDRWTLVLVMHVERVERVNGDRTKLQQVGAGHLAI